MKKGIATILLIWGAAGVAIACPACERQQPKFLRGILHGAGPEHSWDYIILVLMIIVTLLTLYFSVKWLVKPGEKSPDHIKRSILEDQDDYE